MHLSLPEVSEYELSGHGSQVLLPWRLVKVPGGHDSQEVAPWMELKLPGLHGSAPRGAITLICLVSA